MPGVTCLRAGARCPEFSDYLGDTGAVYRDADHDAQLIAASASWIDEHWKDVESRAVLRPTRIMPTKRP
jgi:hypothetical protein